MSAESAAADKDALVVLWTSGDKEVATKMVLMYTLNSRRQGWWNEVCLIVWGPSAKLLSEDQELQDYIKKIQKVGIKVMACKACADMYGVSEVLEGMGLEVVYIGKTFTEFLKGDYRVITL